MDNQGRLVLNNQSITSPHDKPQTLLGFVSPQNTIANSSGEFGLDETSTECKVSVLLNVTILINQMQPYFYIYKLKNVSLTFQLTFLLNV